MYIPVRYRNADGRISAFGREAYERHPHPAVGEISVIVQDA
jgi:hypothetical protein